MIMDKPNGCKEIIFEDAIKERERVKFLADIDGYKKSIWTNIYAVVRFIGKILGLLMMIPIFIIGISSVVLLFIAIIQNDDIKDILGTLLSLSIALFAVVSCYIFILPLMISFFLPKSIRTCQCKVWKIKSEIKGFEENEEENENENNKIDLLKEKIKTRIKGSQSNEVNIFADKTYKAYIYTDKQYSTQYIKIPINLYISISQNPNITFTLYKCKKRKHKTVYKIWPAYNQNGRR